MRGSLAFESGDVVPNQELLHVDHVIHPCRLRLL